MVYNRFMTTRDPKATGAHKHLFWIDLEMTGLDENQDKILEIAAVVTNMELTPIGEFQQVVFQSNEVLEAMNDWCKEHHGKSGLTAEVPNGQPLAQVEAELLTFLSPYFRPDEKIVLAGNSISNDRRFIDRYMPQLKQRLHYRSVDVSSFKEIFRDRFGIKFEKRNSHRAKDDIYESIAELQHYLRFVQIPV